MLRRIHPRYRAIYRLESLVGPLNCWEELQQYQFNILCRLGLLPHHTLLDIGCGPLTVGLKLIPYLDAGNYVGLDVRPQPLIAGYQLIAKAALVHKNPTLVLSGNFGKDVLHDRSFDRIWMSQLSCHLDDAQILALFAQVSARMKPGAAFLFDILDPELNVDKNSGWSGFSFHSRSLDYFETLAGSFGLSMASRGRIEEYGYPSNWSNKALKRNLVLEFRQRSSSEPVMH